MKRNVEELTRITHAVLPSILVTAFQGKKAKNFEIDSPVQICTSTDIERGLEKIMQCSCWIQFLRVLGNGYVPVMNVRRYSYEGRMMPPICRSR